VKNKQFAIVLCVLLVLGLGLAFIDAAGKHAPAASETQETVEQQQH
jgi:hypothetical protein